MALKTLQATKYPEINSVVNKIGSIFGEQNFSNWIEIDFTEWEVILMKMINLQNKRSYFKA